MLPWICPAFWAIRRQGCTLVWVSGRRITGGERTKPNRDEAADRGTVYHHVYDVPPATQSLRRLDHRRDPDLPQMRQHGLGGTAARLGWSACCRATAIRTGFCATGRVHASGRCHPPSFTSLSPPRTADVATEPSAALADEPVGGNDASTAAAPPFVEPPLAPLNGDPIAAEPILPTEDWTSQAGVSVSNG